MWKTLTPEDLDKAYSPSTIAANYREVVADYGGSSRSTLARAESLRLSYGETSDEYVILFEPQGRGADSLLVFFHGGYWQDLSAEDSCFPADSLLSSGMAYAAVNYTLAPHASIATIVAQSAKALKKLAASRPNARIAIAGSSAGAHLAAMLIANDWQKWGLSTAPFHAAVLLSGVYDLRPLVTTYINKPLGLDAQSAAVVSPSLSTNGCHCRASDATPSAAFMDTGVDSNCLRVAIADGNPQTDIPYLVT
ncbi:alpha/beta hydrolase [Paraburkholderia sp. BL25I1N1]|uniref:alpha/beta hydrolase n=1 Tax=Paraburkholderia sp. BL25I1N1 TaxID=1938804 RepID=UPI000D05A0D2|nr:alpha/beta hydrolase [Paraburkholderia sp. BL25I1N1]PRY04421.1 arylformamidase [Paraburkholderia sp. BL25I1N1]